MHLHSDLYNSSFHITSFWLYNPVPLLQFYAYAYNIFSSTLSKNSVLYSLSHNPKFTIGAFLKIMLKWFLQISVQIWFQTISRRLVDTTFPKYDAPSRESIMYPAVFNQMMTSLHEGVKRPPPLPRTHDTLFEEAIYY
jgi:hypothetical protein